MSKYIMKLVVFLVFVFLWGGLPFDEFASAKTNKKVAKTDTKNKKGFRFPSFKVKYFQYSPKRRYYRRIFNFAKVVGKKPIILFYFLPAHKPSITELKVFAATSMIFKDKVKFLCVTKAQTRKEAKRAYQKLKKLKITLPVLLDEKGLLAYVMLTRRVPAYSMITRSGYLRLAGAGSLTEKIDYTRNMMDILKMLAKGKDFSLIQALGYSPNPYDLVGKKAPNFKATMEIKQRKTASGVLKRSWGRSHFSLKKALKKKHPILVIYWSITCPHCRRVVPLVGRLQEKYKSVFSMVGILRAHNDRYRKAIIAFMKEYNLKFKIITQKKMKFAFDYKVMKVPSFFLIDKNGIVRSFRIGGSSNVEEDIQRLISYLK